MRFIIIREEDNQITLGKDGVFYNDIDTNQLDSTIHAVQWYNTYGDIERQDPATGNITANESITSLDDFQWAVDLWQTTHDAYLAWVAEQEALANPTP